MKAAGAILGLVLALAAGYFIFKYEFSQGPAGTASPKEVIDVTGVKSDLLAIGQAERAYMASKGSEAITTTPRPMTGRISKSPPHPRTPPNRDGRR